MNQKCLDTGKKAQKRHYSVVCAHSVTATLCPGISVSAEVLRVLKEFPGFADLYVSSFVVVAFFFFNFLTQNECVQKLMSAIRGYWSYRKKNENVINLGGKHLQLEPRCARRAAWGSLLLLSAVNGMDSREALSCMAKFPRKFFLLFLLFFNWTFTEFAQI